MFIGRKEELSELKERYNTNTTEVISVLGRRRVGKSQLIFQSYKDFDGLVISYECSATTYKANLDNLNIVLRNAFKNDYLSFASLFDILLFLQKEAEKQKILFIIDEYPYMREGKSTDSEIKNAIDKFDELDKKNPLKFVLCGSAVDVMDVLDDTNMPLHGRFNAIIRLFPLNYLESSLLLSKCSLEDKVRYYSVLGGTPYFLNQIDQNKSFDANIVRLFFSNSSLLKTELENQINGEINKVDKATYVLSLIKDKLLSYSDISQVFKSSYPTGEIDYPLNKLQHMKIVEKVFVEQNNGKRKPYYRIVDNAIKFYYSFLIDTFANKLLFSDKEYYELFVKAKLLQIFIPHMFENIGYQFVSFLNRSNKLEKRLYDLFPYIINDKKSKKNYEFDVVGKSNEGLINFECKFQDKEIDSSKVYLEEQQAKLANDSFIETVFISKSEVKGKNKVYYLEDVFDLTLLD